MTAARFDLDVLQQHLDADDIHEIMVVGGGDVFVEGPRGIRSAGSISPASLSLVIERITRFSGRRVDITSPIADVPMPDGSRACIVMPPVAVDGPTVCIRKFARSVLPLSSFTDEPTSRVLRSHVSSRRNIVVSGATSSGKTSLLASLAAGAGSRERIVLIEDTAELPLDHPHVVRLQTRPANVDGIGLVTPRDLVRASMRLRPDRIIVGEVRGGEVVDMLIALTSGHDGCLTTVHARSAHDALDRLVTLGMRDGGGYGADILRGLVSRAIDVVVHVERTTGGRRRVAEILETRHA